MRRLQQLLKVIIFINNFKDPSAGGSFLAEIDTKSRKIRLLALTKNIMYFIIK